MEMSASGQGKEGKGKARRAQVANACTNCRSAKLKCDGQHPRCKRCADKNLECEFDVAQGVTRREQMKQDLAERTLEVEQNRGLLHYMTMASDEDATTSLARLRIGATLEDEYNRIKEFLPSSQTTGGAGSQQGDHGQRVNEDAALQAQNRRLVDMLRQAGTMVPDVQTGGPSNYMRELEMYQPRRTEAQSSWDGSPPDAEEEEEDLPDAEVAPDDDISAWANPLRAPGGYDEQPDFSSQFGGYENIDPQVLGQHQPPPPPPSRPQHRRPYGH